jgi:hypothetical protein
MKTAEAARALGQVLADRHDAPARQRLATILPAMAARLEPAEAARLCPAAARLLSQALTQNNDWSARRQLVSGLVAAAGWMEPAKAVRILNQTLLREKGVQARQVLLEKLVEVAGQLPPADAARECAKAVRLLFENPELPPFSQAPDPVLVAEEGASRLLQSLDSEVATAAAWILARRITDESAGCLDQGEASDLRLGSLERFLTIATRQQVGRRSVTIALAIGISANGPAPGFLFLPAVAEPLPCRFPTQNLVELLKMPTCVGKVRRVILDQLGNRYGRRFDTHWDFVRYAQEQGLDLDFTTPPRRPGRKLPPLFDQ